MIAKPKEHNPHMDSKYIIVKNDGSNMADLQTLLNNEYSIIESWVVGTSIHHLLVKIST
jgi:hypothetical protein